MIQRKMYQDKQGNGKETSVDAVTVVAADDSSSSNAATQETSSTEVVTAHVAEEISDEKIYPETGDTANEDESSKDGIPVVSVGIVTVPPFDKDEGVQISEENVDLSDESTSAAEESTVTTSDRGSEVDHNTEESEDETELNNASEDGISHKQIQNEETPQKEDVDYANQLPGDNQLNERIAGSLLKDADEKTIEKGSSEEQNDKISVESNNENGVGDGSQNEMTADAPDKQDSEEVLNEVDKETDSEASSAPELTPDSKDKNELAYDEENTSSEETSTKIYKDDNENKETGSVVFSGATTETPSQDTKLETASESTDDSDSKIESSLNSASNLSTEVSDDAGNAEEDIVSDNTVTMSGRMEDDVSDVVSTENQVGNDHRVTDSPDDAVTDYVTDRRLDPKIEAAENVSKTASSTLIKHSKSTKDGENSIGNEKQMVEETASVGSEEFKSDASDVEGDQKKESSSLNAISNGGSVDRDQNQSEGKVVPL